GVLTFGRGSPTERELKSSTYQVPMKLSEITPEIYRERVAQACEFLEGHSCEMMAALAKQMRSQAEKLDFEKAAELRNMLDDLRRTTWPTRRSTRGSLPTTIDPDADVRALAEFLQENPAEAIGRQSTLNSQPSTVTLVRLPDLIIVDGGKGQLSSACKELQRLGLHELPIIGLAKEHEEIYRPSRALPLQLPEDSGALRLLQRIRDEAHRFANAYHQLLMKKRIGESILDDCPGVSQHRKNLLLRRFGSVKRLRRASVEEIAATDGIGQKLAADVHRFLQTH